MGNPIEKGNAVIALEGEKGVNILPENTFLQRHCPANRYFAEGDVSYVFSDTIDPKFVIKKAQRGLDSCILTEAIAIERIIAQPIDICFTNDKYGIEIAVPKVNGVPFSTQAIHQVENGERLFVKSMGQAILNAHRKGVVIRDIKTDQFLIKPDGTAELVDYSSGIIWPNIDSEQLSTFNKQIEAVDKYINWQSRISGDSAEKIKKFCEEYDRVFSKENADAVNYEIQYNDICSFFEQSYSVLLPIFGREKYNAMMDELKKEILPQIRIFDLRSRKTKIVDDLQRKTEILRRQTVLQDSLAKWRGLVAETQKILGIQTDTKRIEDYNLFSNAAQYVSDKTAQFLGFSNAGLEASLGFPITYNLPSSFPTYTLSRYNELKNQVRKLQNTYVTYDQSETGLSMVKKIMETYHKNYLTYLIEDWNQLVGQIESILSNNQIKTHYIPLNLFKQALKKAQEQLDLGQLDEVANLDETIAKYLPI